MHLTVVLERDDAGTTYTLGPESLRQLQYVAPEAQNKTLRVLHADLERAKSALGLLDAPRVLAHVSGLSAEWFRERSWIRADWALLVKEP